MRARAMKPECLIARPTVWSGFFVALVAIWTAHNSSSASADVVPARLVQQQPFEVLATEFEGADIGEKINAASKAYAGGVRILVPAGRYPFSTTIRLKPSDV